MHPACPTRNKIIYKTACSKGPNSGLGRPLKLASLERALLVSQTEMPLSQLSLFLQTSLKSELQANSISKTEIERWNESHSLKVFLNKGSGPVWESGWHAIVKSSPSTFETSAELNGKSSKLHPALHLKQCRLPGYSVPKVSNSTSYAHHCRKARMRLACPGWICYLCHQLSQFSRTQRLLHLKREVQLPSNTIKARQLLRETSWTSPTWGSQILATGSDIMHDLERAIRRWKKQ